MGILDIMSYTTVGEAAEDMQTFEDLEQAFNDSFSDLANDFFGCAAENITNAFVFAAKNPLCLALVSAIFVVLAFHLIPKLFRPFDGR